MRTDEQRLLEELGNTQTVKDVQAAYNQLVENRRQLAVQRKHARQNQEKTQAEYETFLEDLLDITGLPLDSPLFMKLALMTIQKRLARRRLVKNALVEDQFPSGW